LLNLIRKVLVPVLGLLFAGSALAMPITFEVSAYGRLQSGPLTVGPILVALTYTFDADAFDEEPSPAGGSFSSTVPARLQIGSESAFNAGGVGMFTGFDGTPQTYVVSAAFSRNTAYFLGREFFVGGFDFIDFDRAMFISDSLPIDTLFAREAERHYSTLTFFPIPGDPAFGTSGYTQFNICDPRVVDVCVNAPLTLRRINPDDDNDGVLDAADQCLATPLGAIVNAHGCAIVDLCPCVVNWKNHAAYVSCVARTAESFVASGLLTKAQKNAIISKASASTCGSKK
jgi:hypothetical protein